MSNGYAALAPTEDDLTKMLKAKTHIGSKNKNHLMSKYIHGVNEDGHNIFNLHKTWEKMVLAARVLVAIENPKDICAISGRPFGTRAVLKFCKHVGATSSAGRYTPGTFTNYIQKAFIEPRVLVVTDPIQDHQPIRESSYVNVPVIALCNAETPLRFIDVAIPCNNTGVQSIGLMWWFLAREMRRLRSVTPRATPWDVMPDLYFYRDPEEVEKEEQARAEAESAAKDFTEQPAIASWDGGAAAAPVEDWAGAAPAAAPAATFEAAAPAAVATADEWGSATAAPGAAQDWGAANWDAGK